MNPEHGTATGVTDRWIGGEDRRFDRHYLSDGGHFDNMELYELVRRRCRYIVICDSEDDGALNFEGIGMAIRKARIDFGVDVALDLRSLQRIKDSAYSASPCVVGTVTYPEDPDSPGTVVYIKSSLTGDEPADVLNYKNQHPVFPHDSTTNQSSTSLSSSFQKSATTPTPAAGRESLPSGRKSTSSKTDGRDTATLTHLDSVASPKAIA
jgi:hypothetical protein